MDHNDRAKVVVHLCFSDYTSDPDKISDLLGMLPSAVHKCGDKSGSRTTENKRSFWATRLHEQAGPDVGMAIEQAVKLLMPKANTVALISKETTGESYLGVSVRVSGDEKTFTNIESSYLSKLGEMGLNLDIDGMVSVVP